jgi:hypothetical protein
MKPERLLGVALATTFLIVVALLAVLFFQSDAAATQRCIDKGYDKETCAWL